MAEEQIASTETKQSSGKLVSAGKPERAGSIPFQPQNENVIRGTLIEGEQTTQNNTDQSTAENPQSTDTAKPEEKKTTQPQDTTKKISDEDLAAYFEAQGIKYEGIDKLKEKINYVPPTDTTETPEQKTANELAKEKKVLDLFIANGGTAEQFVAIKNIAKGDVTELSVNETKLELKAAGFTDEQVTAIIKERYYQIDDDEIEQLEEETDKEFAKRKKEYGAKKLANRSLYKKQQAEQVLNSLQKAIESSDLQKQDEVNFQSNVDESLKSLPRKVTFQLGKIDDKEIAPIEHEVSEESITKVSAILKDPAQRNNFFYTKDGNLNLSNISDLMVKNYELERALRGALLEGQSRQVKIFEEIFPARTAQSVGVGGAPNKTNGQKGTLVSAGKPQVVRRTTT